MDQSKKIPGAASINIASAFIAMARKFNQFNEGDVVSSSRKCNNCVRRQFSFPDTCNDGWPMGSPSWTDRGAKCINWTERGMQPAPLEVARQPQTQSGA